MGKKLSKEGGTPQTSKYICCGIIYVISVILVAVAGFFLETGTLNAVTNILLFCLTALFVCILTLLAFLGTARGETYIVGKIIVGFFLLAVAINIACLTRGVSRWLLFAAGMWSVFGIVLLPACNAGYKGETPVKYPRKIAEVCLQLAFLLSAVILQALVISLLFAGINYILTQQYYFKIKKERYEEDVKYNVGASEKVEKRTVSHDIRDANGVVVGAYDTEEEYIVHDNGDRVDVSRQSVSIIWHTVFILPLRIVSFLFSIFALIIPHMYVSAYKPENLVINDIYNGVFRLTDIIVFRKNQ